MLNITEEVDETVFKPVRGGAKDTGPEGKKQLNNEAVPAGGRGTDLKHVQYISQINVL